MRNATDGKLDVGREKKDLEEKKGHLKCEEKDQT